MRSRDFYRHMLDVQPQIVHFSGHGVDGQLPTAPSGNTLVWEQDEPQEILEGYGGGIALEDDAGKTRIVRAEALAPIFGNFKNIECIFLNACYSMSQAEAMSSIVPHVVGMNTAVPDHAAIEFARVFYDTLGASENLDIPRAFQMAKDAMPLLAAESAYIPEIKSRS